MPTAPSGSRANASFPGCTAPVLIQLGQHVPVNSSQKGNHNSISSPRNDKQLKYGKAAAKYSTVLILHQKKKSDKKNKPSCVHISLNMYPGLRFPPAFAVMNMSTCQGSRTAGPTARPRIGERLVRSPPLSAARSGAKSSGQRATDMHFPLAQLLNYSMTAASPLARGSVSVPLELPTHICKMLCHPAEEDLG